MESDRRGTSDFRLSALKKTGYIGALLRLFGPLGDRILSLKKMDKIYRNYGLAGMDKVSFVERVLKILGVHFSFDPKELDRIPKTGRVIVTSNHPFGGIEGLILASILCRVRPDIRILANLALRFIAETRDFFIFTNPLKRYNPKNISSIRACSEWLKNEGLLVLFPAGKVAYYHKGLKRITDGRWNGIAARLANLTKSPVVPVHTSGRNSALFYLLGRIFYRFRLLMLPREVLNSGRKKISIHIGRPISYNHLRQVKGIRAQTEYMRMRTYLLSPEQAKAGLSAAGTNPMLPVMPPVDPALIEAELAALPLEQRLVDNHEYSVYYGYYGQIEHTVREIGRLRETTYRDLDEGSGKPSDTDDFDKTYTHLFIWDRNHQKIVGAYRMGQIDQILERSGRIGLRLSELFHFSDEFLASVHPGLEMGRSFIRREYQRSHTGLALLWKGIGEFLCRHPWYHTLYGTVSIATTYLPVSIALMDKVLVGDRHTVKTKSPLRTSLPWEVENFIDTWGISHGELSVLVRALEPDGADIPILVKQYLKIGARFHSMALDMGFGMTPGALLTVDARKTPLKYGKMYMGESFTAYLKQHSPAEISA
ncbi:MAG TPA: GNAT family N-acyltransferase [Spirochaetia bacterium]|nr:GNAT family N-acyltransferase [Spirochaetia bacterium]